MDATEVQTKAKSMGWVPQEEFRSDPSLWVDAEEFVRRGEEILPIVKSTNRRLEQELADSRQKLSSMEATIKANQEAMEALKQSALENAQMAAKAAYDRAKAELKEAREAGDIDAEEAAREAMDKAREAQEAAAKPTTSSAPTQPQIRIDPVLEAWVRNNPWYGVDQAKTARANALGVLINTDEATKHLRGQEFLDEVSRRLEGKPPVNKVAGDGSPSESGRNSGGGAKSYEALPPDAKAACDRQGRNLVGEGRAYKTQAEWRKAYTAMYFQGE